MVLPLKSLSLQVVSGVVPQRVFSTEGPGACTSPAEAHLQRLLEAEPIL